jgi:hypothetical protein
MKIDDERLEKSRKEMEERIKKLDALMLVFGLHPVPKTPS